MRPRALRIAFGLIPFAMPVVFVASLAAVQNQAQASPQRGRSPAKPTLAPVRVPHPNSVKPEDVLENIRSIAAQTSLVAATGIPELAMRNNELRLHRVFRVRSERRTLPDYVVAELDDLVGHCVANAALTLPGVLLGVQNCRGIDPPYRSYDVGTASARVRARRGRPATSTEYVYFDNGVEPGSPIFQPLAAVSTERGVLYFNGKGEAFIEEGAPIVDEFGGEAGTRQIPPAFWTRRLRAVDPW